MPDNKVAPAPQPATQQQPPKAGPEAATQDPPPPNPAPEGAIQEPHSSNPAHGPTIHDPPPNPAPDVAIQDPSAANGTPAAGPDPCDPGPTPADTNTKRPRKSSLVLQGPSYTSETKVKKRVSFSHEDSRKPLCDPNASPIPAAESGNNNNNNNPPINPNGAKASKSWQEIRTDAQALPAADPFAELQPFEALSSVYLRFSQLPVPIMSSDEALKFDILDEKGNRLFVAAELSSCCAVCYCRTDRSFTFAIQNAEGKTVFLVRRPCTCCCCCGAHCCGDMCGHVSEFRESSILECYRPFIIFQSMRVEMPDGGLLGEVGQVCRCCRPTYVVKNCTGKKVFRLRGPCWGFCFPCRVCCPAKFRLLTFDPLPTTRRRARMGRLSSRWNNLNADIFSEGYTFGVSFPLDLDVRLKATLLGAAILVDFLHFQKDPCAPSQYCC